MRPHYQLHEEIVRLLIGCVFIRCTLIDSNDHRIRRHGSPAIGAMRSTTITVFSAMSIAVKRARRSVSDARIVVDIYTIAVLGQGTKDSSYMQTNSAATCTDRSTATTLCQVSGN